MITIIDKKPLKNVNYTTMSEHVGKLLLVVVWIIARIYKGSSVSFSHFQTLAHKYKQNGPMPRSFIITAILNTLGFCTWFSGQDRCGFSPCTLMLARYTWMETRLSSINQHLREDDLAPSVSMTASWVMQSAIKNSSSLNQLPSFLQKQTQEGPFIPTTVSLPSNTSIQDLSITLSPITNFNITLSLPDPSPNQKPRPLFQPKRTFLLTTSSSNESLIPTLNSPPI